MYKKVNNVFTEKELISIKYYIDKLGRHEVQEDLGRVNITGFDFHPDIVEKILGLARDSFDFNVKKNGSAMVVEYSSKYGLPNLPPHFDGDDSDLIFNFQLESNTHWDVGVGIEAHPMEDNSAIMFRPNADPHWRPHKAFKEGEYVKMIFLRFQDIDNYKNYEHMNLALDDPIFDEANQVRDSMKTYL